MIVVGWLLVAAGLMLSFSQAVSQNPWQAGVILGVALFITGLTVRDRAR